MTTILAWLWQGLAIACATALILRRMERVNAATRHAIWWIALVTVILLPIARIATIVAPATSPPSPDEPPMASALVVVPAVSSWIVSCAVAIWLATAVAGVARIAISLRRVARLAQDSQPFDARREMRLTMWTSVRGSRRRPELRVADMACGACALGPGRPIIVVSRRLVNALGDEELDQIVMHEYAHLARFDDWSRLAQAIITSVAGLHPAVRFINRQIDLEREAACDDLVVSRTGAAKRYAACLADAATISVESFDAALVPSAIGSRSMLHARVGRLLEPRRLRTPRLTRACCVAGVLLFAGIVFASKDVTPVVMFLESHAAAVLDSAADASPEPFTDAGLARNVAADPLDTDNHVPFPSTRARSVVKRPRKPPSPLAANVATDHAEISSTQAHILDVATTTAPLDGRPLEHAYGAPAATPYSARSPDTRAPVTPAAAADATWSRAADAGVALGSGAKRAGLAIGAFFTRGGKSIGKSF